MRFLILFVLATVFSGCGVLREIAVQTCTNGRYNLAACPNILDRMVPKAPAVKKTKKVKCQVKTKTWQKGNMTLQESSKTCKLQ